MDARQFFIQPHEEGKNKKLHSFCPRCGNRLASATVEDLLRPVCPSCGYIQYLNPSPGAVVLIEREGTVLLGKRRGNVRSGKWSLPGGYINFDENFLSAAHREVLEETGLHIEITSILSVVSNFISSSLHTLVIVLAARVTGGRARPGDDIGELLWIAGGDSLPDMAFESDRHIIRRYFENEAFGAPVDDTLSGSPF